MKTLKFLMLILLSTVAAHAQTTDRFTTAMKKGLSQLDSAETTDQFTQTANYFERIAGAEQKQWLPQYYSAYTNLLAAITSKGTSDDKDALYDKAMSFADKADALMPNNSEVYVLKGYITFMKMSVDGPGRAMSMMPKAEALLTKAVALNPENPRAYLVRGQDTFYTPEMFGGGKAKAKPFLVTAAEKFEKQSPANMEPQWGKARCAVLLKQCD